jgi:myosin heavy subunit
VDGVDEVDLEKEYMDVVSAMVQVGFETDERRSVWAVLGADTFGLPHC